MRSLLPPLLLATLLLTPAVCAGTEADPEVPGVRDHPDPTLDFLGAWLEATASGVRFTVKVASLPQAPRDQFYAISFDLQGARLVAVVAFDAQGRPHTDLRANNFNVQRVGAPEALAGGLEDVEVELGSPAYVSAHVPFGATAGFTPGKVLVDLYGGTGTYDRRSRAWNDVDGRETTSTFVLERSLVPLAVRRNPGLFLAGSVLALAALGGLVAYALHRRRGRAPPPPPPGPPEPPQEPPAPRRMGLDPRR